MPIRNDALMMTQVALDDVILQLMVVLRFHITPPNSMLTFIVSLHQRKQNKVLKQPVTDNTSPPTDMVRDAI
jgi:hypothetical protein